MMPKPTCPWPGRNLQSACVPPRPVQIRARRMRGARARPEGARAAGPRRSSCPTVMAMECEEEKRTRRRRRRPRRPWRTCRCYRGAPRAAPSESTGPRVRSKRQHARGRFWNGTKTNQTCWKGDCTRQPCFGFPNDERLTRCGDCKVKGMADLKHRKCKCRRRPSLVQGDAYDAAPRRGAGGRHGPVLYQYAQACGKHQPFGFWRQTYDALRQGGLRENGMVDLKSRMRRAASTDPPSGSRTTRSDAAARGCREEAWSTPRADVQACGEHQTSGSRTTRRRRRGAGAEEEGMVDLKSRMCEACGEHQPASGSRAMSVDALRAEGVPGGRHGQHCQGCAGRGKHQPTRVPGRRAADACGCVLQGGRHGRPKSRMCPCGEERARYDDADGNKLQLAVLSRGGTGARRGRELWACRSAACSCARYEGGRAARALGQGLGRFERLPGGGGLVEGRQIRPDGFRPTRRARPRARCTSSTATAGTTRPTIRSTAASRSSARRARPSSGASATPTCTRRGGLAGLAAGYTVAEMWEHDFKEVEKLMGY